MHGQVQMALKLPPARKEGIQAALDHAQRVHEDWADIAFLFLCNYSRTHAEVFAEDVTKAAETENVPMPPTTRAWGGVYLHAQRTKILGPTENYRKRANGSPAMVYKSLLFGVAL